MVSLNSATGRKTDNDAASLVPQSVDSLLTRSAIFLVVVVNDDAAALGAVRGALAGLPDLVKTVGFRDAGAELSCTAGIGSRIWTGLTGRKQPAELRPFREIAGARHTAVSTPGDLLFHIRAEREDFCFEFERLLLKELGSAVTVVDEVFGFRYFDSRDLLGFVDGTANPVGPDLPDSTLVAEEDSEFAGGSYVVVQKYLHTLDSWQGLSTEQQESIIGRTKLDNVELDDAVAGQKSHKTLATVEDGQGEHGICATTCRSGAREVPSSAPTLSAIPGASGSSSECWSGCSSVTRPVFTIESWISPPRIPGPPFSLLQRPY